MVKLRQDSTGKYIARKRLPDDVREEYGRRHKAHYEAKFFAPSSDGPHIAKQKFREWDAEVTARIEAIRAERASRSPDSRREHWLANGITGSSQDTPRLILSNGAPFASACMRRCAKP
jgi:hypothetical protein